MQRPILILYATRDGHTERIAEHVSAALKLHGFPSDRHDVAGASQSDDLDGYAAVVAAASVHRGSHESEMIEYVRRHRAGLERLPSAFLSVSLSEAGVEQPGAPAERRNRAQADVESMIDRFVTDTGWQPDRVLPVAGALLYSKYGWLKRFVMRRISESMGGDTDTSRDYEYTDWRALDAFVKELTDSLDRDPQ